MEFKNRWDIISAMLGLRSSRGSPTVICGDIFRSGLSLGVKVKSAPDPFVGCARNAVEPMYWCAGLSADPVSRPLGSYIFWTPTAQLFNIKIEIYCYRG